MIRKRSKRYGVQGEPSPALETIRQVNYNKRHHNPRTAARNLFRQGITSAMAKKHDASRAIVEAMKQLEQKR
jgi:hypothetical protein